MATPVNSATPHRPSTQTHEKMRVILIQTTQLHSLFILLLYGQLGVEFRALHARQALYDRAIRIAPLLKREFWPSSSGTHLYSSTWGAEAGGSL